MSRQVPWIQKPPSVFHEILEKSTNERFFLVQEVGPTCFWIKDESAQKFKVRVGPQHFCSCGDRFCVHILFVLLRIFFVEPTNPLAWQLSLTDAEISQILSRRELRRTLLACNRSLSVTSSLAMANSNGGRPSSSLDFSEPDVDNQGSKRRNLGEDDNCPICQDLMTPFDQLTYCQGGCGNNIHVECMLMWNDHQKDVGTSVTCPLCRQPWLGAITRPVRPSPSRNQRNAHYYAACTKCKRYPIVGSLYRCTICRDKMLLCVSCYIEVKHGHQFECRRRPYGPWRLVELFTDGQAAVSKPQADVLQGRQLTPDDYHMLLELDEMEKEKAKELHTLHPSLLTAFPKAEIDSRELMGEEICPICRDSYEVGQSRRLLPCAHYFHAECIDEWLTKHRDACPVCNVVVLPAHRGYRLGAASSSSADAGQQQGQQGSGAGARASGLRRPSPRSFALEVSASSSGFMLSGTSVGGALGRDGPDDPPSSRPRLPPRSQSVMEKKSPGLAGARAEPASALLIETVGDASASSGVLVGSRAGLVAGRSGQQRAAGGRSGARRKGGGKLPARRKLGARADTLPAELMEMELDSRQLEGWARTPGRASGRQARAASSASSAAPRRTAGVGRRRGAESSASGRRVYGGAGSARGSGAGGASSFGIGAAGDGRRSAGRRPVGQQRKPRGSGQGAVLVQPAAARSVTTAPPLAAQHQARGRTKLLSSAGGVVGGAGVANLRTAGAGLPARAQSSLALRRGPAARLSVRSTRLARHLDAQQAAAGGNRGSSGAAALGLGVGAGGGGAAGKSAGTRQKTPRGVSTALGRAGGARGSRRDRALASRKLTVLGEGVNTDTSEVIGGHSPVSMVIDHGLGFGVRMAPLEPPPPPPPENTAILDGTELDRVQLIEDYWAHAGAQRSSEELDGLYREHVDLAEAPVVDHTTRQVLDREKTREEELEQEQQNGSLPAGTIVSGLPRHIEDAIVYGSAVAMSLSPEKGDLMDQTVKDAKARLGRPPQGAPGEATWGMTAGVSQGSAMPSRDVLEQRMETLARDVESGGGGGGASGAAAAAGSGDGAEGGEGDVLLATQRVGVPRPRPPGLSEAFQLPPPAPSGSPHASSEGADAPSPPQAPPHAAADTEPSGDGPEGVVLHGAALLREKPTAPQEYHLVTPLGTSRESAVAARRGGKKPAPVRGASLFDASVAERKKRAKMESKRYGVKSKRYALKGKMVADQPPKPEPEPAEEPGAPEEPVFSPSEPEFGTMVQGSAHNPSSQRWDSAARTPPRRAVITSSQGGASFRESADLSDPGESGLFVGGDEMHMARDRRRAVRASREEGAGGAGPGAPPPPSPALPLRADGDGEGEARRRGWSERQGTKSPSGGRVRHRAPARAPTSPSVRDPRAQGVAGRVFLLDMAT